MSKALLVILAAIAAIVLIRFVRRPRPGGTAPRIGSPEADAQTLRALEQAGADLTKATEVKFYMYFRRARRPSKQPARRRRRVSLRESTRGPTARVGSVY